MGFVRPFLKLSSVGAVASAGAFFWTTRNETFVPLPPSDHIFHSSIFHSLNPSQNPTTHDLCIRKVPLSDINPTLLEKKGKLVEAFCAGVWGGWGFAFQRAYLARKYQGRDTSRHLWSRSDLQSASYDRGTMMTDHFEVVEKTPNRIVIRCGDSPRLQDIRESDGLFEISAEVKPDEGVAEFGLKSCFFRGLVHEANVGIRYTQRPKVNILRSLFDKL